MCDLMNNNHFKPHQTTINKYLKLNLQIIKFSDHRIQIIITFATLDFHLSGANILLGC